MNVLFLTLLYHPDDVAQVSARSKDGLQNQINNYQWAFIDGLRASMANGERLSVLNALPVGVFPTHYRDLLLKGKRRGEDFEELSCLNLPWFKQRERARLAEKAIERWIDASPDNRTLLVYTLYLPYMQGIERVKRRHPDVQAHVIVTDLPNELGISSGRKGLLKRAEYAMGDNRMALCRAFDGFVLLTAPMAEALPIEGKRQIIIEGLISPKKLPEASDAPTPNVLYTGTLNRELGIPALIDAFRTMPDVELRLCGRGDCDELARQAASECPNIRCYGFVPQEQALALQAQATALINPRSAQGVFTRYSFPSKTLEYMHSGKPVLCCKLEGIPREYDAHLRYIEPQNADGIVAAVRALLALPESERHAIGERSRAFVLREKNAVAQCSKLYAFLQGNG